MPMGGETRGGKVLFVRRGSFSHVNESLLAALRHARPDLQFDDLDIDSLIPMGSVRFAGCLLEALTEYGPRSLRSRDQLRFALLHSAAFYRRTRRLIAEHSTAGGYLFTVQTQSLFNAANGVVPNLVYTDHASLARETSAWDHGLGAPSRRWLTLEAQIYHEAAHVFTFGRRLQREIVDRYGVKADKVSCAGTGANVLPDGPPDFDPARYARRTILFAGIEWERKGGPDLLVAFAKLRRRLADARLIIVGCKPAEAAGVDGCEVVGRVSKADLAGFYRAASCLCVPSRHEPFGNVFVEAGHFGLPVVATTVGEIGDVVHDGENGFRVAPGNPEALEQALFKVLHDPAAASRMGQAGHRLTAGYSWGELAARILAHAPMSAHAPR